MGEAVIPLDQHPSLISVPSLGNTYCTIVLNLKHGNSVAAIGSALQLDVQAREYLGRLPIGSAVVRLQGRWPHPFLVRFPEFEVRKGSVTDQMIAVGTADSAPNAPIRPLYEAPAKIRPFRRGDEMSPNDERRPNTDLVRLLEDACALPLCRVAERYRRTGLSADRGTLLKDELLGRGWARTARIQLATRAFVALVPMRSGLEALGCPAFWPEPDDHAGPEHEFWKGGSSPSSASEASTSRPSTPSPTATAST